MNKNILLALVAVLIIAGGVYWALSRPEATPSPTPTNNETNPPLVSGGQAPVPAAAAARTALATRLGVAESVIAIQSVEQYTWTDGCLGLGGPAESCLAAMVDGYRVAMEAQGQTYIYRTDLAGAVIRAETN